MQPHVRKKLSGDEAYYEIHSAIFKGNKDLNNLISLGTEYGLDNEKFNNCVKNNEKLQEVLKDSQDARAYGVNGTPGFFINGIQVSELYLFKTLNKLSKTN